MATQSSLDSGEHVVVCRALHACVAVVRGVTVLSIQTALAPGLVIASFNPCRIGGAVRRDRLPRLRRCDA